MTITRTIHSFLFTIKVQENDRAFFVENALITKQELEKIFPSACDPWQKFQSFLCSLEQLYSLPHDSNHERRLGPCTAACQPLEIGAQYCRLFQARHCFEMRFWQYRPILSSQRQPRKCQQSK